MDNFLVVTNKQKDQALACTNRIRGYLERHGKICHIETGDIAELKIKDGAQCVITLGGDGTLLRAARAAAVAHIPLIGVNLGSLGYLAEINSGYLEEALEQLMADDFMREERMMLSGRVLLSESRQNSIKNISLNNKKKNGQDAERRRRGEYALNDIAITRRGSLQTIRFHIYVNGQLLYTCHADGFLVATPTGSTGYNLSAGGPIVEPHAKLILLTPICPHTLHARTIVLSAADEVAIEIGENKKGVMPEVEACFDGSVKMEMYAGDKMEIKRADQVTEILKLSQDSFVEALRRKMGAE